MRNVTKHAVTITAAVFVAGVPNGHAQSLSDLIDRAKSEAQRAATQAVTQRPAPAASSPTSTQATTTAPAPSTALAPTAAAPAAAPAAATPANPAAATDVMRKLPAWTQKQASGIRTLDFRNGIPEPLKGRGFTSGSYVQIANPYLPADRLVMLEAKTMACHPEGGVVVWAKMIRQDITKPGIDLANTDTGVGAYRMEADGRVTPFAARDEREVRSGKKLCNTTLDQVFLPDWSYVQHMLVEPGGDVLLASGSAQAVLRFRRDGRVERVAGGGEGLCSTDPYNSGESGHRDGPAAQALFKGTLAIARASDGAVYVAEGGWLPGGGASNAGNCSVRRIAPDGRVSTVYGSGRCEQDAKRLRDAAMTSVQPSHITIDRAGQLVVVGLSGGRTPEGDDAGFSKAFRIDPATGRAQPIAVAATGGGVPKGWPGGRFADAVGVTPDGTPVAFNDVPRVGSSYPGLVVLDKPEPTLRHWWKVPQPGGWIDGPQLAINAVLGFCSAPDGTVYFLQKNALRRLDPKTGEMTTWLH
jgi:hypothetical protein